jgi:hypothetical protein
MNYKLCSSSEYFYKEGLTSLTTMLMEIAIWLEETNAYVEAMNIQYVNGEVDHWSAYVTHSGTLVHDYDEVKVKYDLTKAIDMAQSLLTELLS